jgi:hypothetical protein
VPAADLNLETTTIRALRQVPPSSSIAKIGYVAAIRGLMNGVVPRIGRLKNNYDKLESTRRNSQMSQRAGFRIVRSGKVIAGRRGDAD